MIVQHNGQPAHAKELLTKAEVEERKANAIELRDEARKRMEEARACYAAAEEEEFAAGASVAEWEAALAEFPVDVPDETQDAEDGEVI